MTNSVRYFTGRNMSNVCRAFRTMKWSGLLIIWTGCVVMSPFPTLRLTQHRFSLISILQVSLQGSAYGNSEAYAVPGKYSQHRTRSRLTSSVLTPTRSPLGVIATYTRGPSMVRKFVSNVCECLFGIVHKLLLKCIFNAVVFPVPHH